jgi:cell division protein FtsW (lipid II flippase)
MEYSFRKEPTLKVFLLCIATIGGYLMYKLFQLSQEINKHDNEISNRFMILTVVVYSLSLVSLLWGFAQLPDTQLLKAHLPIHIFTTILDMIWIVKVRNSLNSLAGAKKGQKKWLNAYLTSVFHVIYFQYMINNIYEQAINKSLPQIPLE